MINYTLISISLVLLGALVVLKNFLPYYWLAWVAFQEKYPFSVLPLIGVITFMVIYICLNQKKSDKSS